MAAALHRHKCIPSPASLVSPRTHWSEEHGHHLVGTSVTPDIASMQLAHGVYLRANVLPPVTDSPSTVTQVHISVYPVFLVDKLKATIYASSDATASMLGRTAHSMESLSLYDATVGLKQHNWSRAVAALAMGSSWTALE